MLCMGYHTIENVSQPAAIDGILDQDRYIDILSKEGTMLLSIIAHIIYGESNYMVSVLSTGLRTRLQVNHLSRKFGMLRREESTKRKHEIPFRKKTC
ncbi:hypothetical protein RO3G_10427 [Rhizopus delemar RA 99-880]|uniref:Uncharacterized protein n=1 Tax=Rhizopus delemar (strain RA 99-880 / ATCC MYA-4621 / FGSC 9543 / NRRL 43880) TaxID=246409 RepID=I1CB87_RHIO9|nr:hypothetical protein RO3G_10427 [Rhizopus delemar RA 99-880]|eukprot:EIE85717.1 hypothetical protein RO3G_10427 [Rhizopus delemar RA 99-880]